MTRDDARIRLYALAFADDSIRERAEQFANDALADGPLANTGPLFQALHDVIAHAFALGYVAGQQEGFHRGH